MDKQFLSDQVQITTVLAEVANGTSAQNGAAVDMTGFDNVLFIVEFGTAAADTTVNAAQGDTSGGSFDDLAGTEVASGTAETVWLDIARASDLFIRPEITRGTSTTIASVLAIRYNPRTKIVDNLIDGELIGEAHPAPVEGTK